VYPALAISVAGLVAVSLLSAPPAVEKWKPFFAEAVKEVGWERGQAPLSTHE